MLKCVTDDTCVPELKLYVNLWFMHMHCTLICAPQLQPSELYACAWIFVTSASAQSTSAASQQLLQSAIGNLLVHVPDPAWTQSTALHAAELSEQMVYAPSSSIMHHSQTESGSREDQYLCCMSFFDSLLGMYQSTW